MQINSYRLSLYHRTLLARGLAICAALIVLTVPFVHLHRQLLLIPAICLCWISLHILPRSTDVDQSQKS